MAHATAQTQRKFRSSPHQEKPETEKKSLLKSPGTLLVAGFGFLFVGYIFNLFGLAKALDGIFGGLNQSAHSHDKVVSSTFITALPLIGAGMLILIALSVLRWLGPSQRTLGHVKQQEIRGIEAFIALASERGVSLKVSRAAYRVLLPQVRKGRQLGMDDTLCRDLKVRPEDISNVYGTLLRHTDRRRRRGDDISHLTTVEQMLKAVDACEDKSVPTATILTFKNAAAVAAPVVAEAAVVELPVAVAAIMAEAAVKEKPKKQPAVLVHPARLARREMSMIRSRIRRGA